jgi:ABC-2 type transport system ATP-binding protein
VIETRQLTKRYGNLIAANHVDIKLEPGDVFGFIGPNGSGKTTTMRMLATLLNPDYGEAYVCGYSIYTHPQEIRRLVGYMPDKFGVYDDMKVIEYLEFFAAAYRINGAQRRKVCEEKLELVDMAFKRDAMVNQLSHGQTQRVGLARVLLHEPQVLLLDEPANGLDPRARIEIRGLLRRLGEMGKTIMVSSHILPELADACNKVGMIEKGKMVASASVAEVMKSIREAVSIHLRVAGPPDAAAKLIEQHGDVATVSIAADGLILVTLKKGVADLTFLPTLLIEARQRITLFKEEEVNLETAYMELTKGLVQ